MRFIARRISFALPTVALFCLRLVRTFTFVVRRVANVTVFVAHFPFWRRTLGALYVFAFTLHVVLPTVCRLF